MIASAENDLQTLLRITEGDETEKMNLLQGGSHCPISDLCVSAADVYGPDAAKAVKRLMGRPLDEVIRWAMGDGTNVPTSGYR